MKPENENSKEEPKGNEEMKDEDMKGDIIEVDDDEMKKSPPLPHQPTEGDKTQDSTERIILRRSPPRS